MEVDGVTLSSGDIFDPSSAFNVLRRKMLGGVAILPEPDDSSSSFVHDNPHNLVISDQDEDEYLP